MKIVSQIKRYFINVSVALHILSLRQKIHKTKKVSHRRFSSADHTVDLIFGLFYVIMVFIDISCIFVPF